MITTDINYAKWLDIYKEEKPYLVLYDIPEDHEDQRTTNIEFETVKKDVHDIRDSDTEFTLDQHGFTFKNACTTLRSFSDRRIVDEVYLPETEKLLREEVEGVDQVFFFDWRVSLAQVSSRYRSL